MSDIAYNYAVTVRTIDIEALLVKGECPDFKQYGTMITVAMAAGAWMQQNDVTGIEANLVKLLRLLNASERVVCLLAVPLPKLEQLAKSDIMSAWVQEGREKHERLSR
jgi:hypothetical protein